MKPKAQPSALSITRADARMVAEEIFKLLLKNGLNPKMLSPERYMNTREAAAFLSWPVRRLYRKINEVPHVKRGKSHVFSESSLRAYIEQGNINANN